MYDLPPPQNRHFTGLLAITAIATLVTHGELPQSMTQRSSDALERWQPIIFLLADRVQGLQQRNSRQRSSTSRIVATGPPTHACNHLADPRIACKSFSQGTRVETRSWCIFSTVNKFTAVTKDNFREGNRIEGSLVFEVICLHARDDGTR
ncbi:hypothetical protein B0H19DRAFT_1174743 [Mycena capillaripes]|nr:hypothetical protein B0H19DRAFT_1174743 [Mycena capillaripes]